MNFSKIVKSIGLVSLGFSAGVGTVIKMKGNVTKQKEEKVDKFKKYYETLLQWVQIKQDGKNLEQYFINNGYSTIAIYGMGEMGTRLYNELKDTSITVKYAIDKNAEGTYSELNVVTTEDELESVDAVIVSAIFAFDDIEEELSKMIDCPIISLQDVVFEI